MREVAAYESESQLGTGPNGVVERGRQTAPFKRPVAIKRVTLSPERARLESVRRRVFAGVALDHPHSMRILHLEMTDDEITIVMQLAAGGSLADLIARRGRLSEVELVGIVAPVADALASAHRNGVMHYGIRPSNILFTSDGEPLLSDFGVAQWTDLVNHGVMGTIEYQDAEITEAEADQTSDIYSLGVVCYEVLAGALPFTGTTTQAVQRAARFGAFRPLAEAAPGIPPALSGVVERAMARQPELRYADAEEFGTALRHAIGHPTIVLPSGRHVPSRGPARPQPEGTRVFAPPPAAP